ncbi:MAG TPA: protein translocase subunit SecD [Thermomicrobiales bacterium]|nr:protein translocase subunit SecD [Thermomicrobiales bacterium]
MRIRPWYVLIFIVVLALVAGWVVWPGQIYDPTGSWRANHAIREGLDLQGGLQVLLQANPPPGQTVDSSVLEGTKDTITRRVNGLGVSEPVIQTRGSNQIIVELPGLKDPADAVKVLQQTALLEIVSTGPTPLPVGQTITTSLGGPGTTEPGQAPPPRPGTPGASATPGTPAANGTPAPAATPGAAAASTPAAPPGPVYQTIISGKDLSDAYPTTNQVGALVVGFSLKGSASSKFYDFTSSHIGQYMSVVVDKQVINSASINGAISGSGIIEGMDPQEVNNLVLQLKSGALAVPLEVVQSQTVGPTLGQDSIRKSIEAGVIGLIIVALFMVVYYRLPGLLADVALLLYAIFAFAIFKALGVVLTLAGIAGFILSIGMAVDANVLIFSRMKEELHLGRTLSAAIEAGFDHAWPSIRDSNISTMITCAILYWFGGFVGASIIQGFALTLLIGVAVSMFTAVTVTRTFLRLMVLWGAATHPRWYSADVPAPAPAGD